VTAYADEDVTVYWCVVCGPCLRELLPDGGTLTIHRAITHPNDMTYDEEEKPQ
jgi:hypothetical protein